MLLILTAPLLSAGLLAQESPTTPRAAQVRIIQGPAVELATAYLTIVRWTTNNPGGSAVSYGIVYYGASPERLTVTAKSPVRLNPGHQRLPFAYASIILSRGRPIIFAPLPWTRMASSIR